jgi:hypothetical protein
MSEQREVLAYRVASRINWKSFTSAQTALSVETALRSGAGAWRRLLDGGLSTDQGMDVRKVLCEVSCCLVRGYVDPTCWPATTSLYGNDRCHRGGDRVGCGTV